MHLLSAFQMVDWYSNGGLFSGSFNYQTNFHDLKPDFRGEGLNTEHWNTECFEVQITNGLILEWLVIAIVLYVGVSKILHEAVMNIYSDKLAHVQVVINCRYSLTTIAIAMVPTILKPNHWKSEQNGGHFVWISNGFGQNV